MMEVVRRAAGRDRAHELRDDVAAHRPVDDDPIGTIAGPLVRPIGETDDGRR